MHTRMHTHTHIHTHTHTHTHYIAHTQHILPCAHVHTHTRTHRQQHTRTDFQETLLSRNIGCVQIKVTLEELIPHGQRVSDIDKISH